MILRPGSGGLPLVAVVCAVPLLSEALSAILDSIAEVRAFPARCGDTIGLLRSLGPDAIVVDTEEEAENAAPFARESGLALIHVLLRERRLRVLSGELWEERDNGGASPEAIRNILVGAIYGPGRAA
jgi:hypothetical protein